MIIVLVQIVFRRTTETSHLPAEVYSAPGSVVEVGVVMEAEIGAGFVWGVHSPISLEDHHISYPSAMNHGDSHDLPNDA